MSQKNTLGFIILRHVRCESTNKLWIACYDSIRKNYPENLILIIDDSSDYNFITTKDLYKTTIINGKYPKRGELLPYYYYLQNKLFDTAVIIHDSVFINKYMDLHVDKYKFIWDFAPSKWDQIEDETRMIKLFNDIELLKFYENKNLWKGCMGGMSIITYDFLQSINNKYDLSKLLNCVLTRYNRASFERVIACLLQKEHPRQTLLGDINEYCKTKMGGGALVRFNEKYKYEHLLISKVFTGR